MWQESEWYAQHRLIVNTSATADSTSTTDAPYMILIPIYISDPMTYSLVN